jgi:hypothetical protein
VAQLILPARKLLQHHPQARASDCIEFYTGYSQHFPMELSEVFSDGIVFTSTTYYMPCVGAPRPRDTWPPGGILPGFHNTFDLRV